MKFWVCKICHLKRIAVAVLVIILFVGTLDLFVFGSGQSWHIIYFRSFVITTMCAFFCTLLTCSLFLKIYNYPRPIYYLLFSLLITSGVFLGVIIGSLILDERILRTDIFLFSLLVGLVSAIIVTSYQLLRENLEEKIVRLKEIEIENERLKRYELEARLSSLQAKLNPHFLFNTLNSTAALIYDNPLKAEESIVRLSDLYRKVFSISNQNFIPLGEEIELIEDILELEKLRFEDYLSYKIVCSESIKNNKIPGLLIEPLVENVIKHIHSKTEKCIHINLNIEQRDSRLCITVEDNGPGFDVQKADLGFGLYSIQERLRLLFGDKAGFNIDSKSNKGTKVTIWIPVLKETI